MTAQQRGKLATYAGALPTSRLIAGEHCTTLIMDEMQVCQTDSTGIAQALLGPRRWHETTHCQLGPADGMEP
jgi:hypothetical protein